MSNVALLVVGFFVTLMVAASLSMLFWAAVLDGRDEDARLDRERKSADAQVVTLEPGGAKVVPLPATGGDPLTRGAA